MDIQRYTAANIDFSQQKKRAFYTVSRLYKKLSRWVATIMQWHISHAFFICLHYLTSAKSQHLHAAVKSDYE